MSQSDYYKDSGSQFSSWEEYTAWNITQPCANKLCNRLRCHRAKYCYLCSKYATAFGNPNYRRIERRQYREWEDRALDLIQFNSDNILVTNFTEKLLTIVDHANRGLTVEWGFWFKHLDGVLNHKWLNNRRSPEQYLAELAGVYCFYHETGSYYIKTDRMWHYTLADIMLRGAKGKVRPRTTAGKRMHRFGKAVWGIFSRDFLPVAKATMKNETLKKIREQELATAVLQLPEEENQKQKGEK